MDNATIFFENLINAPHTVLGFKLKPLCIYHLLWLQHVGSPFVITSHRGTIEDVEKAVLICSSSSEEEIIAKLNPGSFWQKVKRSLWTRRNRRTSVETAARAFLAYQADYCALPEFAPSESGSREEKIPWLLSTAANLIKHTGWKLEEVLRLPVGQVFWLNLSFSYLETGETSILSDKEKDIMELMKRESELRKAASLTDGGNA